MVLAVSTAPKNEVTNSSARVRETYAHVLVVMFINTADACAIASTRVQVVRVRRTRPTAALVTPQVASLLRSGSRKKTVAGWELRRNAAVRSTRFAARLILWARGCSLAVGCSAEVTSDFLYGLDNRGSILGRRGDYVSSPTHPALRPTQPPIPWVPE
jgi:hypothetical protein